MTVTPPVRLHAMCCRKLASANGLPALAAFQGRRLLSALIGHRLMQHGNDVWEVYRMCGTKNVMIFLPDGPSCSAGSSCPPFPMPAPCMQVIGHRLGMNVQTPRRVSPSCQTSASAQRVVHRSVGLMPKPMQYGRLQAAAHCMCL